MKRDKKISKESILYDTLRGMCLRLGVNGRLPTVSQLCKTLETSCSTLDRVLRLLKDERIIICRQGSGIFVSPYMGQRTIGLVFANPIYTIHHSPFWPLMLSAAQAFARERGHELRIYFECPEETGDPGETADHFPIARDLEAGRLDGMIALCNSRQRQWLKSKKPPTVTYNTRHDPEGLSVCIDLKEMITLALGGLAEAGCQRVGLVTPGNPPGKGQSCDSPHPTPLFEQASRKARLTEAHAWHYPAGGGTGLSYDEFGYHFARATLGASSRKLPFDGLLVTDDMVARGILTWMHKEGTKAQRRVKIATFANTGATLLKAYEDEIFQVDVDPRRIMKAMIDLLEIAMAGTLPAERILIIHSKLTPPHPIDGPKAWNAAALHQVPLVSTPHRT